jgi:hypothetical protein
MVAFSRTCRLCARRRAFAISGPPVLFLVSIPEGTCYRIGEIELMLVACSLAHKEFKMLTPDAETRSSWTVRII